MTRVDRQASLKSAYGELYSKVSRLVRETDPIRLIAIGAPDDEYDPEVSTILPRLSVTKCLDDVHRIVHEEFVHWFGADIAGPAEDYAVVSEEIWNAWQHSAGTEKGVPPDRGHGGRSGETRSASS